MDKDRTRACLTACSQSHVSIFAFSIFPNENVCQPAFGGGPRGGWRRPKEDSTVDTATITTSFALDIVYFINVVLSSYIRDASRILTNQRPVA